MAATTRRVAPFALQWKHPDTQVDMPPRPIHYIISEHTPWQSKRNP